MARGRAKKSDQSSLHKAVEFCKLASNENAEQHTQHMTFINGYAYRYDGILAVAYPCADQISVAPLFEKFEQALKRVGNDFEILISDDKMIVKGGKLRAHVPVMSADDYPAVPPDAMLIAVEDEAFRGHMTRVSRIASDTSSHVITASILLTNGFATSTDRNVLLQTRHGVFIDGSLSVPKTAIAALLKSGEKLLGFGYSEGSITFWFESGAFIRSQLYAQEWPDVDAFLPTTPETHKQLPKDFFEAVENIVALSETDDIVIDKRGVSDGNADDVTASLHETKIKDGSGKVSGKRLLFLRDFVDSANFDADDKVTFFGTDFRATIQKRH